jgi:tricorn protease
MMKHGPIAIALCLGLGLAGASQAREAKLIRSPSYHDGKVAFSYLGDIWTAREDGSAIVRLTVNKARDLTPRFSPDGKTIAFSSDREGGLDVYLIPATGGEVRRLTQHSADDTVLGWTPDGKSVLFASQRGEDFMGKLYTVSIDGGASRNAGPDMGTTGSFSPDGTKLAINRKAQSYWRKYYRGAYQSDVTVMDLAGKTFKDVTDFDGMDSWPMWSNDGRIYFVSDRDPNAQANLWFVPESGGEAVKVTDFKDGDVRFPSISSDGKTIVFERDFGMSKLDLATKAVTPLHFDIAAETQESLVEFKDYNSTVDDFDVAPNGKRIAFAVHGRIFTAPTDENGELRQITDGPVRDQNLTYSPDGKLLAFVSDKSGREEIYVTNPDGSGEPKKITEIDALKPSYLWSPDSKQIAFTTSEGKLATITAEGKDYKEIASSKYGNIGRPAWSPDGKWLAFSKPDVSRSSDVYLVPAAGGEAIKVTFDSLDEMIPQFSADAKKLYFVRREGDLGGDFATRPSSQIFCIPLEKMDKDPEEVEAAATPEPGANPAEAMAEARRAMAARVGPAKEPKIDWAGLKRRTRQVTRMGSVRNYIPAGDGKTLIFVGSEGGGLGGGGGGGGAGSIYTIQDDGKRLNQLASGTPITPPAEGDTPPPGRRGGGGFGGGISSLSLTKDGRTLYFQEGDGVYSTTVSLGAAGGPGGGGGGGAGPRGAGGGGGRGGMAAALAAATPSAGGGSKKKVTFNVTLEIDKPGEWAEMFDDAWRTMKYRFYDAKMHGKDWDAMRAKYKPLVTYVGDRHELMNVINEMIGELNASHTGASAGGGPRAEGTGAPTRHLGIDLEPDDASGRYKVGHVYEDGPVDKDWFKIEKGNYLIAIDGKPVKSTDDVTAFLGRRLNRKVELTLNAKPEDAGSWKIKYEPIAQTAFANLRYERWVKERRAKVDELSHGRIGYLHIKAMDQPSLARFKKDLAEFRHKEGLVIDQRWNGGGNIEQELLAILVQRPYQVWQPRGTEPTPRPFNGYFGPKVVLQNWRSASNAEMFPAGFRALGLGKVIGTPTMGAVIGTGSYSLIDGSTIRTPGVGVYLSDQARTNMENTGVKPDVLVENSPEDNLAGRDRQLEVGVNELMKGLKPDSNVAGRE